MQSDALSKLRFALQHVLNNPGRFASLKEAYLRWLINISEESIPQALVLDFRRLMQEIGELAFLNGPLSEKRADELIVELDAFKERLVA